MIKQEEIEELAAAMDYSATQQEYDKFISKANAAISENGRRLYNSVAARISAELCIQRKVLRGD